MSSVALLALHPSCNFITSSLSISLPSLGSGFPKSLGSCLHHFSKLLKYYELLVKTGPCCPVPRACIRLFYPQPHSSYLLKQLWILGNLHELILKMAFIYLKYQISSVLVFFLPSRDSWFTLFSFLTWWHHFIGSIYSAQWEKQAWQRRQSEVKDIPRLNTRVLLLSLQTNLTFYCVCCPLKGCCSSPFPVISKWS